MAESTPPQSSQASAKAADAAPHGEGSAAAHSSPPPVKALIKSSWPIPALLVAAGVLGAGMYTAFSNRPKADPSLPLVAAEKLVAQGEYAEAIDALNGPVLGFKDSGLASKSQEARFYLARARAFAGQQGKLGISRAENHQRIVEDFKQAEELGGGSGGVGAEGEHREAHAENPEHDGLGPSDVSTLVESLIALGSVDEALSRIAKLPSGGVGHDGEEQRARKLRLTRLLVEHNLQASDPKERRDGLTLDLLARMATDPDLPREDHAWVLAKQAELLLSLNRVEEAITKLLRELQRLQDVPPARQGELYVLLGKAYVEVGQDADAAKQLEAADKLLAVGDSGNPLRADAAVLFGRLVQRSARGKEAAALEPAREKYTLVTSEFRGSRAYLPAVLGLAEIDASAREYDESVDKYQELSHTILTWKPPAPPIPREADRAAVTASLMARWGELFEEAVAKAEPAMRSDDLQNALRFALVAEMLYPVVSGAGRSAPPAELLLALGQTHRRIADDLMTSAREAHSADFTVRDLDPATRAEVKRHYLSAGDAYRRHAERVSSEDTTAFAASQWVAADSFDLAGDLEEASKSFSAYIDGAADTDANRPAAKFRLAQIFEAQGDHKAAQSLLEGLRTPSGDNKQPATSGEWADRAIVPLAMCYLADADSENDARAEQLLMSVIDGRLLGPEAKDYRDALIELGNMYYAAGRYTDAITRLEEVVNRYAAIADVPTAITSEVTGDNDSGTKSGGTPAMPSLPAGKLAAIRFKLADSHRLEASKIAKTLQGALPQAVENQLKSERVEHLGTALKQYAQVRATLETMDVARMTELEKTFLRNAYFSIGDCAFELGDYPKAVAAYDAAALKYVDDPASLVAMVQIVNAYVAQGQTAQARAANERARRQLARFPDDVWNRADLPMEKKHWEKWLESRQLLDASAAVGGGS